MEERLLTFYEQELTYLREMGKEFAKKYPKIANRLMLEEGRSPDPHVERLMQGFAFLTARIQRKLSDDLPEITESLLSILYPHYMAPIPSLAITQMKPKDLEGQFTEPVSISRHTKLYSKPINGTPCQFRTAYPVTIYPLKLVSAGFVPIYHTVNTPANAKSVLKLRFQWGSGVDPSKINLEKLRFYLNGEGRIINKLYELIYNQLLAITIQPGNDKLNNARFNLTNQSIKAVGFEENEALLDYPDHAFSGYRLLQEYFVFPEKFYFFDLDNLNTCSFSKEENEFEILFYFDDIHPLEQNVNHNNFLLGCTPVVNLFQKTAGPIPIDHRRTEYHLIPDLRRLPTMEVYSIDKIVSAQPYLKKTEVYYPFYSFEHNYPTSSMTDRVFWVMKRRQTTRKDINGTEVFVSLVNSSMEYSIPDSETLTAHVTCTNRDLPSRLPFGDRDGDFNFDGKNSNLRIVCIKKPTPSYRNFLGGDAQWRLISHLSLNYLSLLEGSKSLKAFQEILLLYDFRNSAENQQKISGIVSLNSKKVVRRISTQNGGAVARGLKVQLVFDESKFVGSSILLLATVLERFLGLYISLNSFCELEVTTKQRIAQKQGSLKQWKPRGGSQILM